MVTFQFIQDSKAQIVFKQHLIENSILWSKKETKGYFLQSWQIRIIRAKFSFSLWDEDGLPGGSAPPICVWRPRDTHDSLAYEAIVAKCRGSSESALPKKTMIIKLNGTYLYTYSRKAAGVKMQREWLPLEFPRPSAWYKKASIWSPYSFCILVIYSMKIFYDLYCPRLEHVSYALTAN